MKKTNQWMLITIVLITLGACSKTKGDCRLISARVIRYDCDRVIFQLQTPEMMGDSSWKDYYTGQVYSNVISAFNTCEIAALTKGEMRTIYIDPERVEIPPAGIECVQCLAVSKDPPATKMVLKEMKDQPCENAAGAVGR